MTEDVLDVSDIPVASLLRLDGRGAVVTGAARGLGAAIARRLHEAGASVVVADLDGDAARATVAELAPRAPGPLLAAVVDVREPGAVHGLAEMATVEFGRLDIWVNNAGISLPPIRSPRAARRLRRSCR